MPTTAAQRRAIEAAAAERARQQSSHQTAVNTAKSQGPPKGLPAPAPPAKGIPWPGGSSTAPAAPAAPARAPFQWTPDSGYNDAVGLNKRAYDETIGNLDTDERNTKFDFGVDDPTNPFSRMSELKRTYLAQGRGSSVSLANRGQLYSGANLNAIARNKRNEEHSTADLRQAYEAALEAIRRGRVTAKTKQETDDLGAYQSSFDRQLGAFNA